MSTDKFPTTSQTQSAASEDLENFQDALPADSRANLFRVGVRIPPSCPDRPALWFAQIEGQFVLSGITSDSTKFYYILAQLEREYAVEVEDIISNPPAQNKYEVLKQELIKRLSASKEQKVRQLLDHEVLGNRKPSQFIRHLQHLTGPNVPLDFIRTIWSSRLPQGVQAIVASHADMPLDKLVELADKVIAICSPNAQVTEVVAAASSSVPLQPHSHQALFNETMSIQIAALTKQIASLTDIVTRGQNQFRSRDRFRSRPSRSRSHSRDSFKDGVCWYHRKFGKDAKKCLHLLYHRHSNY